MNNSSPYWNAPNKQFWKPTIAALAKEINKDINNAELNQDLIDEAIKYIHKPEFNISEGDKFISAGSCFSEHVTNVLISSGLKWIETESNMQQSCYKDCQDSNSFRIGNIYSPLTLLQWLEMATNENVWNQYRHAEIIKVEEGYLDGLRPRVIQKNGEITYTSKDNLIRSRELTKQEINKGITNADLFVLTLGMTEVHISSRSGLCVPIHYGTLKKEPIGDYPINSRVLFYDEVVSAIQNIIDICKSLNQNIKILLTVSPVPMVATHTSKHVLVAHWESKSIIRAAISYICSKNADTSYFPSFEIINSLATASPMYSDNKRDPNPTLGVRAVKRSFVNSYSLKSNLNESKSKSLGNTCDDILLESYLNKSSVNSYSSDVVENSIGQFQDVEFLLLGDSLISSLHSELKKQVMHINAKTPPSGWQLSLGDFSLDETYILRVDNNQLYNEIWQKIYADSFLNRKVKCSKYRVVVTNIGIHPHTLPRLYFEQCNCEIVTGTTCATHTNWNAFFWSVRRNHLKVLNALKEQCDLLLLVHNPPFYQSPQEEFLANALYDFLAFISLGKNWHQFETIKYMNEYAKSINTPLNEVIKGFKWEDNFHGNEKFNRWQAKEVLKVIQESKKIYDEMTAAY